MALDILLGLFVAWLGFGIVALSPGANMLAVASTALSSGRKPALLVALGIALGAFTWALGASYGLASLLEYHPWCARFLSYVGGLYLLYLAYRGLHAAMSRAANIAKSTGRVGGLKAVLRGVTVAAAGPKVVLFWVSISTYIASVTDSDTFLVFFAVAIAIEAMAIYTGYGILFSSHKCRVFLTRSKTILDGGFGICFAILGFVVLQS